MPVVKSQIERCLALIELLATEGRALPLGEISERLELPKSATHRLLHQLVETGWIRQDAATGFYAAALKLALIGQRLLHRTGLPSLFQPYIDDLAHRTTAFARIAVVDGEELTWIGQAQGAKSGLIYQPGPAAEVRLNVTASGKAWLACLEEEQALHLILKQGIGTPTEFGPRALTQIDEIRDELTRTRDRGYALAVEEGEAGVVVVAAAIRAQEAADIVVGTVSVAGPMARMTPDRYDGLAEAVSETAARLSAVWPSQSAFAGAWALSDRAQA